jgi:uncharacterized membrane protein YfcA
MPDPHDLAKVYYSAARSEIVQRLALRESVLLAAVATFGVLAGWVVGEKGPGPWLLSLFPLLSLAFTLVLFRHNWIINDQSDYLNTTLSEFLGLGPAELGHAVPMPLHWDAALRRGRRALKLRWILLAELGGAWFLLWVPALVALYLTIRERQAGMRAMIVVDIVALVLALTPFAVELHRLVLKWKTDI